MMSTLAPIRRQIVVPATPERAFEVFTADMTRWWPSHHHIGSAPIDRVIVEPHEGGRWYTRHTDGSETSTGLVVAWEPPHRVALTWQVGADWQFHADLVTTVEVTFAETDDGRTRVELEHRDLERFGPDAERMHQTFSAPDAWDGTLAAYATAFSEEPAPKHVLLYASADNVLERAPEHYPAHLARLQEFHARGDLLMVGPFGDPQAEGSMAIFRTREAAEEFIADDPFVLNGVVSSYELRVWHEGLAPTG